MSEITEEHMVTEKISKKQSRRIKEPNELWVSTETEPKDLAGAITSVMREHGFAQLMCIGDGAIGRGLRAVSIARGYLTPINIDAIAIPSSYITEINGKERTGTRITVENNNSTTHSARQIINIAMHDSDLMERLAKTIGFHLARMASTPKH
jgi:stage V sporulation protein S